jgi:hypothetical protein
MGKMIELTDEMTDAEIREGLAQRADKAIECFAKFDELRKQRSDASTALQAALDEVGVWMDKLSDGLNSVERSGFWLGWEEDDNGEWSVIIKPIIPPDHMSLD